LLSPYAAGYAIARCLAVRSQAGSSGGRAHPYFENLQSAQNKADLRKNGPFSTGSSIFFNHRRGARCCGTNFVLPF
jgi:hypothetical protein